MKKTIICFQIFATFFFSLIYISCTSNLDRESITEHQVYVCPPCNSECDNLSYSESGVCTHCNMPLILKNEDTRSKRIAFYLQNGVEILDFAGPMEVFAYAGYEVFTVSKHKKPIVTQGILTILPDYSIEDTPTADILAFFGGNASEAYNDPKVIKWVQKQQDVESYFSVCTGAFILAESGLLDRKSATTFHNALEGLEKNYPKINVLRNKRFVDNGAIITTAGISAGIDGALHLVAKLDGFDAARKAAYYMEYDKWVPGEGLLLGDDPYRNYRNLSKLLPYVGTYEFLNGSEVGIEINTNEKSLFAIVNELTYPLFYMGKDTLTNLNGDQIIFERNSNDEISGYKSTRDQDKFYAKLYR